MKRKILVSCTYFRPNISGVTIYVDILTQRLAEKGWKVSVLTSRYKKNTKEEVVENGVRIKRSRILFQLDKGVFMPKFVWDAYKEVKRADVVHCHLPQLESCVLAVLAKLMGKKFIITHHCEFRMDGLWTNRIIGLITYPFHFLSYFLADKIVSYTKDYAKHSIFLRYFFKKIVFVLPPVQLGKISKKKMGLIKKKIGVKRGTKIIAYVGRIAWEKGLDHLMDSLRLVRKRFKVKLVLVGPYNDLVGDKTFIKLKKMIDGDKEKTLLFGSLSHRDLVNFYELCDCLVLPSTNNLETFGIVQPEAMLSGCPVVASNLPGVRVPVEITGLGEIAKVANVEDLGKKIIKVLGTKYPKSKFKKAKEVFSLNIFTEKYERVYGDK